MFGRVFETMFTGSMRGSGAIVFAVWTYVITHMRPDKKVGAQVDLNPEVLAFYLGEKQAEVEEAILFLCSPDPRSTNPKEEGRRLVQIGQFAYRVVTGAEYIHIRNEEDRREYQRVKQAEYRAKKKGQPLPLEAAYVKALEWGDEPAADAIVAAGLPEQPADEELAAIREQQNARAAAEQAPDGPAEPPPTSPTDEWLASKKVADAQAAAAQEKARREAARVKGPRAGKAGRPATGGKAGNALAGVKNSAAMQAKNAEAEAEAFRARMAAALAASQEAVPPSIPPEGAAGEVFPEL